MNMLRCDIKSCKSIAIKSQGPRDACQSQICSRTENISNKWHWGKNEQEELDRPCKNKPYEVRAHSSWDYFASSCYSTQLLDWKMWDKNHGVRQRQRNSTLHTHTLFATTHLICVLLHKYKSTLNRNLYSDLVDIQNFTLCNRFNIISSTPSTPIHRARR